MRPWRGTELAPSFEPDTKITIARVVAVLSGIVFDGEVCRDHYTIPHERYEAARRLLADLIDLQKQKKESL